MKIITFKCDRCGVIAENGDLGKWGKLRLAEPNQNWAAVNRRSAKRAKAKA